MMGMEQGSGDFCWLKSGSGTGWGSQLREGIGRTELAGTLGFHGYTGSKKVASGSLESVGA